MQQSMIRSLLLVIMPALGVMAAQADDRLNFSMSATLDCFEEGGAAGDCIGASAVACMENTPAGYATALMSGCYEQEWLWWDERLNTVYRELMAHERAADAAVAGLPGASGRANALRALQRAWIAWRDATCDYERAQWDGGTGGGPATIACLLRITAEQTRYLEAMRQLEW